MFWILVLAHLMGDYPLQTDRLVLAKRHLPGLLVHVGIHLTVMMVLFYPVLGETWYFLVAVAILHFFIDAFKNFLGRERPEWVIWPYIQDQILHFSSLIMVSLWMERTTDLSIWPVSAPWAVYFSGLLVASYIWFVTERIMVYKSDDRQIRVNSTMWSRMVVRLLLYILVVAPYSYTGFLAFGALLLMIYIYRQYNYLRSWMIVDAVVPIISAFMVRAILAIW